MVDTQQGRAARRSMLPPMLCADSLTVLDQHPAIRNRAEHPDRDADAELLGDDLEAI